MDRRIKSVKCKGSRVEIAAIEIWGGDNEREWTLRCSEEPSPELPAAFEALIPGVRRLLGLPDSWAEGVLSIGKVSFSFSENTNVKGAVITCAAALECADAPLIFNTPHLPFEQYSPTGNAPLMPEEMQTLLNALEREAEGYLQGKRAQANLFGAAA